MTDPEPAASGRTPDETLVRAWLTLIRAPRFGYRALRKSRQSGLEPGALIENPGTLRGILHADTIAAIQTPDADLIAQDLDWLARPGHHFLPLDHPDYPPLLREITDPPLALFVVGDPSVLATWQLAMVGSRNPTPSGARTAAEFARFLGAAGLTITSGMATGIDGAAHGGALQAGGKTIAVLGTGPDRVYPAVHRDLAHEIAASGVLVSEFPPGTGPRANHFPRRNRIISGMALGTLVVEAAVRSGSLITARQAMDQGREVFAIPGSIHNPLARGCHGLIRDGAKLVETAADVIEELGPLASLSFSESEAGTGPGETGSDLDEDHLKLLEQMGYDPITVDELVRDSGLTAEAVSSMLLIMELRGYVSIAPGGRYTRISHEDRK